MRFAGHAGVALGARGGNRVGRGLERGWMRRQAPASVLGDEDRDRVVARGVEVLEDGRRGGERHFVLPRAAAVDDTDAKSLHLFIWSFGHLVIDRPIEQSRDQMTRMTR